MLEDDIVNFIMKSETLKRIHRSGWQIAGVHVVDYESVAAHSWGSSLIALLIARHLANSGATINIERVLEVSLLHDLSEAEVSDIPKVATNLGGPNMKAAKMKAEEIAFAKIIEPLRVLLDAESDLMNKETSLENRVVRAADLLDMLFHAISLENAGADPNLLDDFFVSSRDVIAQLEIDLANSLLVRLEEIHYQHVKRRT